MDNLHHPPQNRERAVEETDEEIVGPLVLISEESMLAAPPIESHPSSEILTIKNGIFFAKQMTKNLKVNGEVYHLLYVHLVDQQQSAAVNVLKSRFEEVIPNFDELNTAERACFRVDIMGVYRPSKSQYTWAFVNPNPTVVVYMEHPRHQFKCFEYTHFPSDNLWEHYGNFQVGIYVPNLDQRIHYAGTRQVDARTNETRLDPSPSNIQSDKSEEVELSEGSNDNDERVRGSARRKELKQLRRDNDDNEDDVDKKNDDNGAIGSHISPRADQTGRDCGADTGSTNIVDSAISTNTPKAASDLSLKYHIADHVIEINDENTLAMVDTLDGTSARVDSVPLESQEELRNNIGMMNLGRDVVDARTSTGGLVGNNNGNEAEKKKHQEEKLEEKHQEREEEEHSMLDHDEEGDRVMNEVAEYRKERQEKQKRKIEGHKGHKGHKKGAKVEVSVRIRNKYL